MDMSGALAKLSKIHNTEDIDNLQRDLDDAIAKKIQATEEQDFEKASTYKAVQKILSEKLQEAKDKYAVFLGICGGYQLLGHYYKPNNEKIIKGINKVKR